MALEFDYELPQPFNENGDFLTGRTRLEYQKDLQTKLESGLENAKAFLRSQRAWKKAVIGMGVLHGDSTRKKLASELSTLEIHKSRRQAREAIAAQSDIQQTWRVSSTKAKSKDQDENDRMDQEVDNFNNLGEDWWTRLDVHKTVKAAQQHGAGAGTGYVFQWPDFNSKTGEIDIIPIALSYKNVFVSHLPESGDINEAYRVDIRLEMPLPKAHKKFPDHRNEITADAGVPSWLVRNWDSGAKVYKGVVDWIKQKARKRGTEQDNSPFPVVNIYYSFIADESINTTGKTMCMGEIPDAHWYYEVPSLYDEEGNVNTIGTNTFLNQEEIKRALTPEDCKIYPKGRLIIWCKSTTIYDGPPQWGVFRDVPISQCYFDKIVGEFLGMPVTVDSKPIGDSVDRMARAFEDQTIGMINSPIGVDENIPDKEKQKIMQLGIRGMIGRSIFYNSRMLQKAVTLLVDSNYFKIDSNAMVFMSKLIEVMDYLAGTRDFTFAQQLKQMPADDTQEALMKSMGVLTWDQSREQERFFKRMGEVFMNFAPQVYNLKRRLQILDKESLTYQMIDYAPDQMYPKPVKGDSRQNWQILQDWMKTFSVNITPNSIQERQSYTKKLALLQLQKSGVTIPDSMLYDALVGDGRFDQARVLYFEEQEKKAIAAARISAIVSQIQAALNPQQPQGGGSGGGAENQLSQSVLSALGSTQTNNLGRPPSNESAARLEQKGDGRTVLASNSSS